MAPMKEMVKKGTGSGTTWIGLWRAHGMDIDGVEIRSRIDLVLAAICAGCEGGERDGTGNGRKCKRSVCLSESRGKEPKECVMEP